MHLFLLRKFFILFGILVVLPQAFGVAVQHAESKDGIRLSGSQDGEAALILEARVPRKSRGGSRGGSRRPPPVSKPGRRPNPGTKPKPGMKPNPGTKPKPETKPTPSPSTVIFPKLKVPYIDTATDLCGIYIECVDKDAGNPNEFRVTVEQPTTSLRKHTLKKRVRKPKGLKALPYPESPDLYSASRASNTKEILRFQNTKVGSTEVKSFSAILLTETYGDNYATEHIIELQTVGLFRDWAIDQDPNLETFFDKEWTKVRTKAIIQGRSNKPDYYAEQIKKTGRQERLTLNDLVFEALGSTVNPSDFVLLENEINRYKKELWSLRNPMAPKKFEKAYQDASTGAQPSSEYLSAIRTVFGVFSYLESSTVHRKMVSINENVQKELRNAVQITGDPNVSNLVLMWDTFLKDRFAKIDEWAKEWTKNSIGLAQKEVKSALVKYEKMFRERENAEEQAQKVAKTGKGSKGNGKATASYAEEQKKKRKTLFTKLAQQGKEMRAHREELRTLKATQKASTRKWKKPQREAHQVKINVKKEDIEEAERAYGVTQRAIHELYSYSVKMIITNLKKDQERLLNFERKVSTLKMPRL